MAPQGKKQQQKQDAAQQQAPQPQGSTALSIVTDDRTKKALRKLLPKHITVDRYARLVLTAFQKSPKLAKCTPASVFQCMMELSATGLEPDGRLAHLIPFENKKLGTVVCTLIIDYKGYVKLALDSEKISTIHGDVVYEKDFFEYAHGTEPYLKHRPARGDRGKPTEAYTIVQMKDGSFSYEVMTIEEVESIRKRSKTYDKQSGRNYGPWNTDYNEMAKKTVFRRHSKWLPLGKQFREAEAIDTDLLIDDDKTPAIEMQMPEELPEPGGNGHEPPPEAAELLDKALVSAKHIEAIRALAKEAQLTEEQLIELAMDHGCKKGLEDLTLKNYGALCETLVQKQAKKG